MKTWPVSWSLSCDWIGRGGGAGNTVAAPATFSHFARQWPPQQPDRRIILAVYGNNFTLRVHLMSGHLEAVELSGLLINQKSSLAGMCQLDELRGGSKQSIMQVNRLKTRWMPADANGPG